jgi:type VI secretion system protein VasG
MADINLEAVAGKLNRIGYEALFKALRQAKGAGNRNVELAHWLVHVLQGERTDLVLTADHFGLDRNRLLTDINGAISGFRKNETEMPAVSNTVMDLLDRGWHYATLFFGETQIRTGHVLVGAMQSRDLDRALKGISSEFNKISADVTARSGRRPRKRRCVRWMVRGWDRQPLANSRLAARKAPHRSTGSRRI